MNLYEKSKSILLDSSLITPTFNKKYNAKLVQCGDYCQLYLFEKKKIIKQKDDEDLRLRKIKIDCMLDNKSNSQNDNTSTLLENIEEKNIIRSKLECQRLAKANIKDWKIFVTLTFADNITDVKTANKRFRYFIDKVRRIKKDFKYLCITEFQKRGAIHYHLLCNIDINDRTLLYEQNDNKKFLHIKYWVDGFTSVEPMSGDCKKVVGYISKYMTKDIDNRLFGHRRYFYSNNLNKPIENYIDLDNIKDKNYLKKIIQDMTLIYQNDYLNTYDNTNVTFLELLSKK